MKIYTRKGDTGTTQLIGGTRVPKYHVRIEAYGTLDELNSFIGLLRDQPIDAHYQKILVEIQDRLFTIGSSLASDPEKSRMKIPDLKEEDVLLLENEIDSMEALLPEMKSFVLPGGNTTVSYCHIARCVCRRAERLATHLLENDFVEPLVIRYLNRLSDYLFVLSRKLAKDLNAVETSWKPRM
ncbi:MAG: cob(I)yrinic acid a,c-diamide adenosyltransferase [Bacteroidota bacterium]